MILAWARLLRLSNLPSVASNILAGYLLVAGNWHPGQEVVWAAIAACCFYSAGIIGNDLNDFRDDVQQRPERPLPSGAISRTAGLIAMLGLFCAGLVICSRHDSGSFYEPVPGFFFGPRLAVALLLVTSILIYDFVLKRLLVSVLFMGVCRGLNLLLGASFALAPMISENPRFFDPSVWAASASITCYVMGLTLLARDESKPNPRRWLMSLGVLSMATGMGGYLWMGWLMTPDNADWPDRITRVHLVLIAVIAFTVIRSASMACVGMDKARIRGAITTALFSLITLDAATALLASGGQVVYSLVILGLLIGGITLSRIVNPT